MRLTVRTDGPPLALAAGGLLLAALGVALFFNGVYLKFYAASGALLVLAAGLGMWRAAGAKAPVPVNLLTVSLSLYWAWLGVNAWLSPAPGVSGISFWWMGALPLTFWTLTLARTAEDTAWRPLFLGVTTVGVLLAGYALLQSNLLLQAPSATFLNRNNLAAFLNLLALPLLAHALLMRGGGAGRGFRIATGALFSLLLVTMLIGSRGALLGLLGGLALLLLSAHPMLKLRDYVYIAALIGGAFIAANLLTQGYITERSLTLADPNSAGASRWLIWERAWAMLRDAPWYGIGIGLFWLAFPPYRDPADRSGGYYVHNDYLQLWIEAGWPGLVLFLTVCAALAWGFLRFLRRAPTPGARLEAAGLFAGLASVGAHSLFSFNLYLLPTLIVAGAWLARLHQLTGRPGSGGRFGGALKPHFVQTLVVLGALFPLLHFGSHFGTEALRQQAGEQLQQGDLEAAHRSLLQAQKLSPALDVAWYSHADVLRNTLEGIDHRDEARRRVLFEMSLAQLEQAQRINPLRPHTPYLRGVLIGQEKEFAGADWRDDAAAAFKHALRIDPRFLPARLAWADLLLEQGRDAEALTLLREGLPYWYAGNSTTATYLWRTARLHASFEEWEAVDALATRFQSVLRLPAPFSAAALRHAHHGSTGVEVPRSRDVPEGGAGGEASP